MTTAFPPITTGCLAMTHLIHRMWRSPGHNLHRLHKSALYPPPSRSTFQMHQCEHFSECCQVMLTWMTWQGVCGRPSLSLKSNIAADDLTCVSRVLAGSNWSCGFGGRGVKCGGFLSSHWKGCRRVTLAYINVNMCTVCSWLGVSHVRVNNILFLAVHRGN